MQSVAYPAIRDLAPLPTIGVLSYRSLRIGVGSGACLTTRCSRRPSCGSSLRSQLLSSPAAEHGRWPERTSVGEVKQFASKVIAHMKNAKEDHRRAQHRRLRPIMQAAYGSAEEVAVEGFSFRSAAMGKTTLYSGKES